MKHLLLTLMTCLAVTAGAQSKALTFVTSGDSVSVVRGGDTVLVVDRAGVEASINDFLGDTLLAADDAYRTRTDSEYYLNERMTIDGGMRLARNIVAMLALGTIVIVFLALLFAYLNRRRKYKMVEKAIENNYPLPAELLGGRTVQQHNIYVTQPAAAPQAPAVQGVPQPAATQPAATQTRAVTNWAAYKGGFITAAVGLGLMLFFAAAGATPMVALMSIILFVGLGKMFLVYQEQRNGVWMVNRQVTQQPPQQQPQQPQPTQVPPQPVTREQPQPPYFNNQQPQA